MEGKENLLNNGLLEHGFLKSTFPLINEIQPLVIKRDWNALDAYFSTSVRPGGFLFKKLSDYHKFDSIEHMLAIRNSEDDEDGIWHDDGSRHIAFSLSLVLNPEAIIGGNLLIRRKNDIESLTKITTQPFGTMVIFLTGQYQFEHKIQRVEKGERIVLVGWCS